MDSTNGSPFGDPREPIPAAIRRLSAGDPVTLVWVNGEGGMTFRIGTDPVCVPNTLIGGDGNYAGHVDLSELGVADRWADLAVGSWSTVWNYGPGWEHAYLAAYGVRADPVRIRYYRHLWTIT